MTTIKELPQPVQDSFSIAVARAGMSDTFAKSVVERGWTSARDSRGHNAVNRLLEGFPNQEHANTVRSLVFAA